MTTSRSQTSDNVAESKADTNPPVIETPRLNCYEIHSARTVLTEPGNTDGWIATDTTVTPER
jgi:hypothetical protein